MADVVHVARWHHAQVAVKKVNNQLGRVVTPYLSRPHLSTDPANTTLRRRTQFLNQSRVSETGLRQLRRVAARPVRGLSILAGSRLGGQLGGQPAEYYNRYWMAFLTQAGVTLGLAQTAAPHFASRHPEV